MPYTKTVWQDGITVGNQTHMNNLESIFDEAMQSFNQDLLSAYVMSGLVASRHNSYASNVLGNSPLQYFRLDETGGLGAVDSSGNGETGTYTGSPTLNAAGLLTGDPDAAVTFNGTSQYVALLNGNLPTGAGAWTMEAWAKPSSGTGAGALCSFGDGGSNGRNVVLAQLSAGGWQVFAWGGTVVSGGTAAAGVRHHVVATFDGTSLRLYVDGALVAGPTAPGVTVNVSGTHAAIGALYNASYGSFFGGTIDEVAIYGSALSAATITAHYNAGTTATTQVDMTSGVVVPVQSDSTTRRRAISSASFTTVTPSTTYYLYAQPDGTTYWSTANTPAANSLAIAQVTTDGSGNVSVVTDKRQRTATLLPNADLGVFPRIVYQALNQLITNTATNIVGGFSNPTPGLYRVCVYFALANSSSGQKILLSTTYDDAITGSSSQTVNMITSVGSSVVALAGTLMSTTLPNGSYSATALAYVGSSAPWFINFEDLGGTPSDRVSVIIERLA